MSLIGKDIIGIDETGNGGTLHNIQKIPLVVTAYLHRDYRHAQYAPPPFGSKKGRKFFSPRYKYADITNEILRCARPFIKNHPDFFYTTIPANLLKERYTSVRAEAVVSLTLHFLADSKLQSVPLDPRNLAVLCHEINGKKQSEDIADLVSRWFESLNLPITIKIKSGQQEKRNPALAAADTIGYYISALRFRGDGRLSWPYRKRRITLDEMTRTAVDLGLI